MPLDGTPINGPLGYGYYVNGQFTPVAPPSSPAPVPSQPSPLEAALSGGTTPQATEQEPETYMFSFRHPVTNQWIASWQVPEGTDPFSSPYITNSLRKLISETQQSASTPVNVTSSASTTIPTTVTGTLGTVQPNTGQPQAGGRTFLNNYYVTGPNGERIDFADIGQLEQMIRTPGYALKRADGSPATVLEFQGGTMVDDLPLDTHLYTGEITEPQIDAMVAAGKTVPGYLKVAGAAGVNVDQFLRNRGTPQPNPGGGTNPATTGSTQIAGTPLPGTPGYTGPEPLPLPTGNTGNTGGTTGGTGTPSGGGNTGLPADIEDALRQLMQMSVDQGTAGQKALTGLTNDYRNFLNGQTMKADQTYNQRNELVSALLGDTGLLSGIKGAIAGMNDSTGLSPEGMAALRMQATEAPERDYQQQVEQLKTQLASRGAYGGGSMPGSAGDIVRGYAPLMTARDSTRSNLLSQAILADEQRKFDTLGLNRQTGAQFAGLAGNLTTGLGSVFNPSSFTGGQENALAGLAGINQAGTNSALAGINTAGGLAGTLGEMQPGSFRNTLLAALVGTGGSILENYLNNRQTSKVPNITVNLPKIGSFGT